MKVIYVEDATHTMAKTLAKLDQRAMKDYLHRLLLEQVIKADAKEYAEAIRQVEQNGSGD